MSVFPARKAELSDCNIDCMGHKAENIHCLAHYRMTLFCRSIPSLQNALLQYY